MAAREGADAWRATPAAAAGGSAVAAAGGGCCGALLALLVRCRAGRAGWAALALALPPQAPPAALEVLLVGEWDCSCSRNCGGHTRREGEFECCAGWGRF